MQLPTAAQHQSSSGLPRRILLFSGSYNHIVDGVTLTLNRLVSYLESRGMEVLVVAPTTQCPDLEHAGTLIPIPSIPMPKRSEYRIAAFLPPGIRARIVRFRPDIVHVATPDLLGRWAMSYARRKSIPVVTTYHTDFASYLRYYGLDFLESFLLGYLRYFYRRCDLVCVPSRSMIDELTSRGINGRMRIWARGVETDRFNPRFRSVAWRRELGIADGVPTITYVGRLVYEKNVHYLAEVSTQLKERGVPHRVVVVGEGPAREELEKQIPNAIFTGRLSGEELAKAYASSDIFLFPSTTETFGNVVLEAMASGLPCVCVEATGSSDLVVHGQTGFLAPPDSIGQIVEHVESLALDPVLREEMGQASLKRAHEFRWEAILGKMVDYYIEARQLVPEVPTVRRMLGMAPVQAE